VIEFGFGTERTGKFVADVFGAAEGSRYPVAGGPGGIVADVLLMATFEIRDPVEGFVDVKTHDLARDSRRFCFQWFHGLASAMLLCLRVYSLRGLD